MTKSKKKVVSVLAVSCLIGAMAPVQMNHVKAKATSTSLSYEFTGEDAKMPGYAQGTISLTAKKDGKYHLYWANNSKALSGYYEIATLTVKKGQTGFFTFGDQTAIPADATKVIAVEDSKAKDGVNVKDAVAVYQIPEDKLLGRKSKDALYTFNSYSDIHIDEEHYGQTPAYWWMHSEQHWAQALEYAKNMNTDFIVSSGDQVTNASLANLENEWKAYQYILSQSDYVNPVWESSGNHEVRQDGSVNKELKTFIAGSGLDSTEQTLVEGKPYYSITEPKTGDLFLFMALESGYRPAKYDEFSTEQLDWLEKMLQDNYGKGKNIYLVQHALISGYGAGDDTEKPYYGGSINPSLKSAKRFTSIIEKYPNIIWISGHTHEAYESGYNYSNNNNTSCHMIHNSSIGNPTHINEADHSLDYTFFENQSQGYYVQTFEDAIIFSGANICDQKIYPAYSYIIPGQTKQVNAVKTPAYSVVTTEVTPEMLRSTLANVKTMLGLEYQYSSYDQYQTLKKCYYEYKDCDINQLSSKERKQAYSMLSSYIKELQKIKAQFPLLTYLR